MFCLNMASLAFPWFWWLCMHEGDAGRLQSCFKLWVIAVTRFTSCSFKWDWHEGSVRLEWFMSLCQMSAWHTDSRRVYIFISCVQYCQDPRTEADCVSNIKEFLKGCSSLKVEVRYYFVLFMSCFLECRLTFVSASSLGPYGHLQFSGKIWSHFCSFPCWHMLVHVEGAT